MQRHKEQEHEVVDVYYVLKPIFYFSRFSGLWIHSLKRKSPAFSTGNLIHLFVLLSIFGYFFYINIYDDFWLGKFKKVAGSDIQTYGTWTQVLSGLAIGMVSLLTSLWTHPKQWSFFEHLDQIDTILMKDFAILTPKKIYRTILWGFIFFTNVIILLLIAMTYLLLEALEIPSLMLCLSYYVANVPYAVLIIQFCFYSNSIRKRFFYINNTFRQLASSDIPKVFDLCSRNDKNERHTPTISIQEIYSIYGGHQLKKNLSSSSSSKGGISPKENLNREIKNLTMQLKKQDEGVLEQIKRRNLIEVEEYKIAKLSNVTVDSTLEHLTKLVDLHDDLLDCISLQNQILSFPLLLILSQIFVFGVITYFSLYRSASNTQLSMNILAYNNIIWIAVYNVILVVIMRFADKCIYEGKFTGTAVHKVINKLSNYNNIDARIIEKLSIISHQLTMRAPDITCGLFSFNWELLFSMISAIAIYLIFLMQFEEANEQSLRAKTHS